MKLPDDELDLDLAAFVVPPGLVTGGRRSRTSAKQRQNYIRHIPMLWAIQAAAAVSPSSAVLLAIRYYDGFHPGKPFEATLDRLTLGVISLDSARRAVYRLEERRLITVKRRPGRKLMITVNTVA